MTDNMRGWLLNGTMLVLGIAWCLFLVITDPATLP
jgi:hypothetical protein